MASSTTSSRSHTPLPLQTNTPDQPTFLTTTPDPPIPLTPLPPPSPTSSAWNSHHPCFPHRNPYVPLSSPLYESTRIIRIPRDYMFSGDLTPAFSQVYPEILDPWIPESLFREVVSAVNRMLCEAFDPWKPASWVDAGLGLVTGWLWEDLLGTATKRACDRVERYLEEVNDRLEEGVRIVELRRSGFLNLDVQIPDPGVDVEEEEDGEGEGEGEGHARENGVPQVVVE